MANPLDTDATTADLIAIILALKSVDDNLQKAYEAYLAGNKAEVIARVKASKFYTDFNATARARATAAKEQPGVAAQDKNAYILKQKKRLAQAGIQWSPTVQKSVESGYDLGLDDNSLDAMIIKAGQFGKIGGSPVATVDSLKMFADSYGVAGLFSTSYWDGIKQKLFLGEITGEDIQQEIKDMAKNTYPGFAQGFDLGQSLDYQTGYIKNTVAKVVGLDPTSLRPDDPMVATWYQWKDPKTGAFTRPPQYLVEQGTKEKYFDLYARTPNGKSYLDGLTVKVLQDMGLM